MRKRFFPPLSDEDIKAAGAFRAEKRETPLRVLRLTLKEKPFDVMVTGEKGFEYRKPSDWIRSRLMYPDGSPKKYDIIEFTNGYGAKRPRFTAQYLGFIEAFNDAEMAYSNGLKVQVEKGDFVIGVGLVKQRWNLKGLKTIKT